jgi:hypothetical protein
MVPGSAELPAVGRTSSHFVGVRNLFCHHRQHPLHHHDDTGHHRTRKESGRAGFHVTKTLILRHRFKGQIR